MPLPKYEFVYELSMEKDIFYYIKKRPVVFYLRPTYFIQSMNNIFLFRLTRPINIVMNIAVWDNIDRKCSHVIVTL